MTAMFTVHKYDEDELIENIPLTLQASVSFVEVPNVMLKRVVGS